MIVNIMRKTANFFLLFVVILFLLACQSAVDQQLQAEEQTKRIQGIYVYGHEVNTFQKCGSKKTLWVIGDNSVLHDLQGQYYKLISHPYEDVYLELDGTLLPRATDGFAVDYDGQINIKKIFSMQKKSEFNCVN
ncbi:MAG: hypothetical protein L3J28_14535 [Candidatus Polarisedimenticolaceae bacterium]|nr:hypothetical protein [Candidatus Polarisedimenticolaceae bacterium]